MKKKYRVGLNPHLIKRQGLTPKGVESLQQLHESRLDIEEAMSKTDDPAELKALFEDWTLCQFELQKGWNFPEDAAFHQFWTVPKCTCPRLDNMDAYPSGRYVVNSNCPVHAQKYVAVDTPSDSEMYQKPPKRELNIRNEIEAVLTVVVLAALATLFIKWYVS